MILFFAFEFALSLLDLKKKKSGWSVNRNYYFSSLVFKANFKKLFLFLSLSLPSSFNLILPILYQLNEASFSPWAVLLYLSLPFFPV